MTLIQNDISSQVYYGFIQYGFCFMLDLSKCDSINILWHTVKLLI